MDENTQALMKIASELEALNENMLNLIKAIREPHYDANDGAIRVSVSK